MNNYSVNLLKRCKELAQKGYEHHIFVGDSIYREFKKHAEKEGYTEVRGSIEFPCPPFDNEKATQLFRKGAVKKVVVSTQNANNGF